MQGVNLAGLNLGTVITSAPIVVRVAMAWEWRGGEGLCMLVWLRSQVHYACVFEFGVGAASRKEGGPVDSYLQRHWVDWGTDPLRSGSPALTPLTHTSPYAPIPHLQSPPSLPADRPHPPLPPRGFVRLQRAKSAQPAGADRHGEHVGHMGPLP
jgi:hypothetical protein